MNKTHKSEKRKRKRFEKENSNFRLKRRIEELDQQLEFERLKREKLESELDECRTEIMRLINTIRNAEDKKSQRVTSKFFEFHLEQLVCL